jgi:beta-lactamase regulating signal transducer with metallopeptidase domain
MARKKSPTLTEAELRLMEILWEKEEATVGDVVDALPKEQALAYSTVLTTMRILEQKGYPASQTGSGLPLFSGGGPQRRSQERHEVCAAPFFRQFIGIAGAQYPGKRAARSGRVETPEEDDSRKRVISMSTLIEAGEPVAQQAVVLGLYSLGQGLVLTLLVIFFLRFNRGLNAATRYAVWGVTLVAVCCLLLLQGLGSVRGGAVQRPMESVGYLSAGDLTVPEFSRSQGAATGVLQVELQRTEEGRLWDGEIQLPSGSWSLLVVGLWGGAVLVLMARLGLGYGYMRRLRRQSVVLPARYQQRLQYWLRQCKIQRVVHLRASPDISTPVVVGLSHPVILIPQAMVGVLEVGELDQIYLHELAHIRRRDHWANLAQKIIAALCCFLPMVWWIGRRLDLEREIACDDWVVAKTGKSRSYAVCLTRLIELSAWNRVPLLASGALKRRSDISTRLALLLDRQRNRAPELSRQGMLWTFAVLCLGLGLLSACENPFAPPKHQPGPVPPPPAAPAATTPEILIDNLRQAMRDRDKSLYEELIDADFWFTEYNCRGDLVMANGREEELEIMGSRDGSHQGILDFRTVEFEFRMAKNGRRTEMGRDYPEAFFGDPDGHPDEDWEVFRGRVEMLFLDDNGDGFRVDQVMTYKLREDEEGLWKMIRWDDDPLSGDCGTAKPVGGLSTWRQVKVEGR